MLIAQFMSYCNFRLWLKYKAKPLLARNKAATVNTTHWNSMKICFSSIATLLRSESTSCGMSNIDSGFTDRHFLITLKRGHFLLVFERRAGGQFFIAKIFFSLLCVSSNPLLPVREDTLILSNMLADKVTNRLVHRII
jgi:hypothetical protein